MQNTNGQGTFGTSPNDGYGILGCVIHLVPDLCGAPVLTIYGLIADLDRPACSKPCILRAKTSTKARLADAARPFDGLFLFFLSLFFWILHTAFGHGHITFGRILRFLIAVPMPNDPHELTLSFTIENPAFHDF